MCTSRRRCKLFHTDSRNTRYSSFSFPTQPESRSLPERYSLSLCCTGVFCNPTRGSNNSRTFHRKHLSAKAGSSRTSVRMAPALRVRRIFFVADGLVVPQFFQDGSLSALCLYGFLIPPPFYSLLLFFYRKWKILSVFSHFIHSEIMSLKNLKKS